MTDSAGPTTPPDIDAAPFLESPKSAHVVPDDSPANDYPMPLDPIADVDAPRRRSAAEEARTILAGTTIGTLASLTADGAPWASVVTFGTLADGSPVLCVSTLAQHGRNLVSDPRASLAVAAAVPEGADPGDCGRVTIAGVVEEPSAEELDAARAAYIAAVPTGEIYADFGDFTLWILRVEKVRWVGGFGRMASADSASYFAAEPDPVETSSAYAIEHLNDDHADALLLMARALGGHPDATSARCLRADRYGLDLGVETPRGKTPARVSFAEPITAADGLRAATVELTKRSRELAD